MQYTLARNDFHVYLEVSLIGYGDYTKTVNVRVTDLNITQYKQFIRKYDLYSNFGNFYSVSKVLTLQTMIDLYTNTAWSNMQQSMTI